MFFSFSNRIKQCIDLIRLKLNNIEIPFVETVVNIDKKLKFDYHTISVSYKVNYKTNVLKKCTYLFDFVFKTTLFKLFLVSSFDYCFTLFFYFKFIKNIKQTPSPSLFLHFSNDFEVR